MNFVPLKSLNNQFGINEKSEIINFKTGRIIRPYIGTDMYQHVTLFLNGKKIRKRDLGKGDLWWKNRMVLHFQR